MLEENTNPELNSTNSAILEENRLRAFATGAALVLLAFALRWTWRSRILYHWDSVQFALALDDFNLQLNQPQPPGYILYVWMGRWMRALTGGLDDNRALVLLSILFTAVSAVLIHRLAARLFNPARAWLAAFLFLTSPLIWFYGEVALLHLGSCMFALFVALWGYRALKGEPRYALHSALALGFLGAFRQQDAALLFPLWVFCARRSGWKRLAAGLVIMAAPALAAQWATIQASGGWSAYRAIMEGYRDSAFNQTSILLGAGLGGLSHNGTRILRALVALLGAAIFLPALWERRLRRRVKEGEEWAFFGIWILPGLLFFLLVHMGQPGLLLFTAPGILLLFMKTLPETPLRRYKQTIIAGFFIANTLAFFFMPSSRTLFGREVDWYPFRVSILERDNAILSRINGVKARGYPTGGIIGCGYAFRHASYYFPDQKVIQISQILEAPQTGNSFSVNVSQDRRLQYRDISMQTIADQGLVPLDENSTEMLLWDAEYAGKCEKGVQATEILLDGGQSMYHVRIPEPDHILGVSRNRIGAIPVASGS